MAALKMKQDSPGRMVLTPTLWPRLGSLLSTLVWLGLVLVFFFPSLGGDRIDPQSILFMVFILVFALGGSLLSALFTSQVIVDQPSRTVTNIRRLLGFPISSTAISFNDISNVEYQYYRQASGRSSHNAWRVNVTTRDNRRIPINWDGKQDEMAALAQKVATVTGGELVDNSTKPVSTAQQILDQMRGRTDLPEPGAQDTTAQGTAAQDTAPQSAAPMDNMPGDAGAATPDVQSPTPAGAPWPTYEDQSPGPMTASPSDTSDTSLEPATVSDEEAMRELRNMSVQDLEQRIKSDPMDGQARHVLARKYQSGGQLDRAAALYQEVLHIDPMDADAQIDLGVALEQQRKRKEAEAAYRRAIALDPFSSTAHLNLGLLLRGMNRATDASQEFYQARQNARTDAESRAAEAASTGSKLEPQLSKIFQ